MAYRLQVTREVLGVKAAEICRRAGLRANQWSQWEAGRNYPDLMAAIRLCDEFGLTLDWIYRGERAGLVYDFASKLPAKTVETKIFKITEARAARR